MPTFTVPINGNNGPGFVTVNATDAASAVGNVGAGNVATGAPISGGPQNIPSGGGGGGVAPSAPPSTVVGAAAPNSAAAQLGNSITQGANLLNAGSKQAFDEYVREFNANFGLNQDELKEKIRQYNEGLAVTQAGLTGTYQGQQTQAAQQQAFNEASTAAGLTGYFQPPGATRTGNIAMDAFNVASQATRQQYLSQYGQGLPQDAALGQAAGHYWNDISPSINQSGMTAEQFVYGPGGQGQQTLANINQRNQIAQQWAGLYGYTPQFDAQGQPIFQQGTGAAGQGGGATLAAQQQTFAQQLAAIQAAAALQANPFRQQQVLGQLGPMLTGIGGVAGFSAPNTVAGVGTQGGTGPNTGLAYMQQMIDDIRNPGANQASMQGVLNAIPTPNKINSQDFLRSAPSTQNLVLQGMQEKYGLDPNDSLAQIKNTLPSFQAPTTFGTIKG